MLEQGGEPRHGKHHSHSPEGWLQGTAGVESSDRQSPSLPSGAGEFTKGQELELEGVEENLQIN